MKTDSSDNRSCIVGTATNSDDRTKAERMAGGFVPACLHPGMLQCPLED